jgi:cytochrome c553
MALRRVFSTIVIGTSVFAAAAALSGCTRDMQNQPKYKNLRSSDLFSDGMSARPQSEGTIAQGQLRQDPHFFEGKVDGKHVTEFPMRVDRPLLERGRERYDIFCAVCHGKTGEGDGAVVQRGFPVPPSYHIDRLKDAPAGYFYDVITNGFGRMYSYAAEIEPRDRWAITAYIRALQASRGVPVSELTDAERKVLDAPASEAANGKPGAHH